MSKEKDYEQSRILEETDQVREIIDVIHFEARNEREESPLFKKNKRLFKKNKAKCIIDNSECEGHIEIHHSIIQHGAANAVDWDRVEADYGFRDIDDIKNLVPICKKHHTGKATGIHMMSYPAWILQRYYLPEPLSNFEAAVKEAIENDND